MTIIFSKTIKSSIVVLLILFNVVTSNSQDTLKVNTGEAFIGCSKMHILYVKIDNPLSISWKSHDIVTLVTDNGELINREGTYMINPKRVGKCLITMIDSKKERRQFQFITKQIPSPTLTLSGKYRDGSVVDKNILIAGVLIPLLDGFDFQLFYIVKHFTGIITSGDSLITTFKGESSRMDEETIAKIKNLKKGDAIMFYNVKAKLDNGKDEELPLAPMRLIIG